MAKPTLPISSNHQPDPRVLSVLYALYRIIFIAVPVLCGITFLVWSLPALRGFMPYAWDAVKADTAICMLFCSLGLWLSLPMQSAVRVRVSRWMAAFVVVTAALAESAVFSRNQITLSGLLRHIPNYQHMSLMSVNTAGVLVLLSLVLFLMRERKNNLAKIADSAAILLVFVMVVIVSGYFFGALRLFGPSATNHMSVPSMLALCALSFVAFSRRAEYGGFSLFLSDSIASRIVRVSAPFALLLPFMLALVHDVIASKTLRPEYASAWSTATVSLLAFILIFVLARRIYRLEQEIRVLSLNDELTGLYNRRGFYLLANQSYALAQRASSVFSILFIDVDKLKQVNDIYGHEEGSALLQEMSVLLQQCFRETDVIGRLGGDEFAIAARANQQEITAVAYRLQEAVELANKNSEHNQGSPQYGARPYKLSFSWGYACAGPGSTITLEALLQQADISMYEAKRAKKAQSGANIAIAAITV